MKSLINHNLLILCITAFFISFSNHSFGQRCTGSSSCRVCTDCSRCAHCKGSGSCGVCASGRSSNNNSSNSYYYSTTPNNGSGSGSARSNKNNSTSNYYLKSLIVNANSLNLRGGPSSYYGVIEKLNQNQELIFLDMVDEWVKVRVKHTNSIGYVHYKYVLLIE